MDTNTQPCRPSVQNELLHELNPGGIDPITVDAPAARPPRPARPMPESHRDGLDGGGIIAWAFGVLVGIVVGFLACLCIWKGWA